MAVTGGYFNSVNGDRKYNADQMSEYFEGIINEGVCQHIGGGLAVTAGTGLSVVVAAGKAFIGKKWIRNDASLTLTISAASSSYARIDAVVLRRNNTTRTCQIVVKSGTPAASPVAPTMTRNSTTYEMALAYVNVAANATSVTVTDKRADTTVCGWATVAESVPGEIDAQLNAMKTGFDGVTYSSPVEMVQSCDQKLQDQINASNSVDKNIVNEICFEIPTENIDGVGVTITRNNNVLSYTKASGSDITNSAILLRDICRIKYTLAGNFIVIGENETYYLCYVINPTSGLKGQIFRISKRSSSSVQVGTATNTLASLNVEIILIGQTMFFVDDKANICSVSQWVYNDITFKPVIGFYLATSASGSITLTNNYINNLAILGDSITYLDKWQKTVSKQFMCSYTNYAVSGSGFAEPGLPDPSDAFKNRVKNITGDYDTFFVFGGTNDFGHSVDLSVFEDAVDETLQWIAENYPLATKYIILPLQRSDVVTNARDLILYDYIKVLKEVAGQYGFMIIDGYSESGITQYNTSTYTSDGLHPNLTGMAMVANCISKNILSYNMKFKKSLYLYLN